MAAPELGAAAHVTSCGCGALLTSWGPASEHDDALERHAREHRASRRRVLLVELNEQDALTCRRCRRVAPLAQLLADAGSRGDALACPSCGTEL